MCPTAGIDGSTPSNTPFFPEGLPPGWHPRHTGPSWPPPTCKRAVPRDSTFELLTPDACALVLLEQGLRTRSIFRSTLTVLARRSAAVGSMACTVPLIQAESRSNAGQGLVNDANAAFPLVRDRRPRGMRCSRLAHTRTLPLTVASIRMQDRGPGGEICRVERLLWGPYWDLPW